VGVGVPLTLEERESICRLRSEGRTILEVCEALGLGHSTVERVVARAGGLPPRDRLVRAGCLRLEEREEISRRVALGESNPAIAAALGRSVSTVWREVKANGGRDRYRAWAAERRAQQRARRPKVARLASSARLRAQVQEWLELRWSPEQISARLIEVYPDDPEMRVSHETIYQSLFVQGRGALRRELTACLRTGRTLRRPRRRVNNGAGKIPGMVMISERPAEIEDRAVPGHWEGDLIMGTRDASAVGTLVERASRYVQLVALPEGRTADAVSDALAASIATLPDQLRRSLTWDQGSEMAEHKAFSISTGVDVYFCDPHSPWQRGTNENTNGLLRQYLPKGTSLTGYTQVDLDAIAAELNGRPRKTLEWKTPAERLAELLALTA
jgi:transposase, IS30 family